MRTPVVDQLKPTLGQQLSPVFHDLATVRTYGHSAVAHDVRAFSSNKEAGGTAGQSVLDVVQSVDGLPLKHTVHAGNVVETKTLQSRLASVLRCFAVARVMVVAGT